MTLMSLLLPDVRSRPLFDYVSPKDWAVACTPYLILIIAARLAMKQYKNPVIQTVRYILLPTGLYSFAVAVVFRNYSRGGKPRFNVVNYGVGLIAFAGGMKLVELTFMKEPLKKVARVKARDRSVEPGSASSSGELVGEPNTAAQRLDTQDVKIVPATGTLLEVIDYLTDPRGIGYEVAGKIYPSRGPVERKPFLWAQLRSAVIHVYLHDLCQTIIQTIPGTTIGTPDGGSIFVDSIPAPQRYMLSTVIVLTMGVGVYAGLEAGFDLFSLFGVGVLGANPASYPPIFDKPWMATSVRDFWSKRWHSLFQNYFRAVGWSVGSALLGTVGGVLGVFTLSGLLHDWTIWGMGKGIDTPRIVGFFYLQGVAVILEDVWRRLTGRKVRGAWGRAWTIVFLLSSAHLIVEAWLQRGLGGATYFVQDRYRPWFQLRNYTLGIN